MQQIIKEMNSQKNGKGICNKRRKKIWFLKKNNRKAKGIYISKTS